MKARQFFWGFIGIAVSGFASPLHAGMTPAPGISEPIYRQADVDAAYDLGFQQGQAAGILQCKGDPASCDIRLSDVLTGAEFGETEPNDHIVAADPIVPEHKYWGQSYGLLDNDWFFFTTNEPNQIVTLNFTVPFRDESSNVSDWIVQVRDAAGNVYAEFSTSFIAGNTNGDNEITYPIFLGHVGTYYVVVKPEGGTGKVVSYYPYNLAIALEYSGMDSTPWDVNFYDVETEPNDTREQADPIATGVTVYGMLHTTLVEENLQIGGGQVTGDQTVARYIQTEEDWFVYKSIGNEVVNLAICGRENCAEGTWFIEVQLVEPPADPEDDPIVTNVLSFNTKTPQVVRFGLAAAGDYYMNVGFEKTAEAECAVYSGDVGCTKFSFACAKGIQCTPATVCAPDDTDCTPEPASCDPDSSCDSTLGDPDCKASECDENSSLENGEFKKVCDEFGELCEVWAPSKNTGALDVEYNFTWWGTKLQPHTAETPAYEEFLERPSWYEGR